MTFDTCATTLKCTQARLMLSIDRRERLLSLGSVAELVDAPDLKSVGRFLAVGVQVPPLP